MMLNLASQVVEWDDASLSEIDEAKTIYRQARKENRKIVALCGTVVNHFKPSLLAFRILGVELRDGQVAMRILNALGDETIVWEAGDSKQIKEAAAIFKQYILKGWNAYAVKNDGSRGVRIREFNAELEEMVFDKDGLRYKLKDFAKQFKKMEVLPKVTPG